MELIQCQANVVDGWKFLKRQVRESGFFEVFYTTEKMLIKEYDDNGTFVSQTMQQRMLTQANGYQHPTFNPLSNQSGVML